ncbi:N-acetylglucosamine-1-phosphotransferase subunits alpha/beta-like [Mercenaria mercenaria]|uniref:N-acetylglucosamine-1-phosphotransferase subunits alpha/beta-like n=1 Tax=Mercenaria mercenaria TaxID=6596 RepID=UPI00234F087F|nr:N-acetylglucosamine-1-phosphotransferase subunits alpha/beta-like [Mercenaria mercenaria]
MAQGLALWTRIINWMAAIFVYNVGNLKSRSEEGWKFNTSFPVDLVYTWVNGSDPKHQAILARLKTTLQKAKAYTATRDRNLANMRFVDNGGLRYSLRSVEKNANWIRHVFIVTNGQVPDWLNVENPRVTIVKHEAIFDHPENLPTFSSHAIEHNIYKIRGISERFIYMNDDWLFGQNVSLADLYTENNGTKVYLAWNAPTQCGEKCKIEMIKNDVCDQLCNYDHCAWDGGDCIDIPEQKPKDKDTAHCDYTNSVLYTNAIYNRAFGIKKRRVIAHAPLFIEKKVNKDMVQR